MAAMEGSVAVMAFNDPWNDTLGERENHLLMIMTSVACIRPSRNIAATPWQDWHTTTKWGCVCEHDIYDYSDQS